jgi:hypothetical protein
VYAGRYQCQSQEDRFHCVAAPIQKCIQ